MNQQKIIEAQNKYIESQLDLYDRILAKVESAYEFGSGEQTINHVAIGIYLGYVLSDVTDAIREQNND
ncbi:hypothetical protein [Streptococcus sp. 20-1249]|uniref:hypothetical protein n=1 Tax=Streptococcus hepaticus TaxID=3349163 RepID=UPI003747C997